MVELNKELQSYIKKHKDLKFHMLQHPLVFSIPYFSNDMMNDILNKQFDAKKEKLKEALKENDIPLAVFLHERPFRLDAFLEYQSKMEDKIYWELLGDIWIDSESPGINKHWWLDLFTNKQRTGRDKLMNEEEFDAFYKLPEKFTIYRGCSEPGKNGISWTTNLNKAHFFANRFANRKSKTKIYEAVCEREDVLAYFTRRDENEIIIDPKNITFINNK